MLLQVQQQPSSSATFFSTQQASALNVWCIELTASRRIASVAARLLSHTPKNDPRDDSKPKRKVQQDDDEPFPFAADGDQKPSNAMTSPEFRKRFEKYDLYEMEPTRENWIKASNWCAQFGIEEYGDRFPKLEKSVDPFSEDGAGVIFKFPRLSKDTFAQLMKKLKQNESEADSKTAKDKFNCLRNIKFIRQYSLISSGAARKGKWGDIIHNAKKFVK